MPRIDGRILRTRGLRATISIKKQAKGLYFRLILNDYNTQKLN